MHKMSVITVTIDLQWTRSHKFTQIKEMDMVILILYGLTVLLVQWALIQDLNPYI